MPPSTYVWIGLAVTLGAFVQGTIGFAFGIFSIPILVWVGLSLQQAIVLVLTLVVVQTTSACWIHREYIPWKPVLAVSAYRFLTVPVGVFLLGVVNQRFSVVHIKQLVGICLLAVVLIQLLVRPEPRSSLPHRWAIVAGGLSGLMAGLVGMGGPPAVLWAMAHDWSTVRARAFLWSVFMLLVPWQLAVTVWRFGDEVSWVILAALGYLPFVVAASYIGARLGSRISTRRMRAVVYAILIGLGLASVSAPYWQS